MPAAIWIAAMVIAGIALIRSAQALDRIVIIAQGASVISEAGAVKLRTQILCRSWRFRAALHAHTAGEARSDEHGLATAGDGFHLHDAFIHVNFSKAPTINLNVKLCSAHGNDRAGRADLESRRSADALLNLRTHAAH